MWPVSPSGSLWALFSILVGLSHPSTLSFRTFLHCSFKRSSPPFFLSFFFVFVGVSFSGTPINPTYRSYTGLPVFFPLLCSRVLTLFYPLGSALGVAHQLSSTDCVRFFYHIFKLPRAVPSSVILGSNFSELSEDIRHRLSQSFIFLPLTCFLCVFCWFLSS